MNPHVPIAAVPVQWLQDRRAGAGQGHGFGRQQDHLPRLTLDRHHHLYVRTVPVQPPGIPRLAAPTGIKDTRVQNNAACVCQMQDTGRDVAQVKMLCDKAGLSKCHLAGPARADRSISRIP